MTAGDHFERVAAVYESLRTTDEAPVRAISQFLPGCPSDRPGHRLRDGTVHAAAAQAATGRVAAACQRRLGGHAAQLTADQHGQARGVMPLRAAAEQLPVRAASLDLVTAFNCVHHLDLPRFLASAARVLRPGGRLFIYTRTPRQNARTIWGRYFPGFTEHEQRLHSEAALRDAVQRAGLTVVATQAFRHRRSSTAERLRAQAQGRHYSTFSLYTPEEFRASMATFLARLPGPEVSWVDEHLLIIASASRRNHAEPDERASLADQAINNHVP